MSQKILLTGGGSGGHITPVLAIAEQLKLQKTNSKIYYIGQKGDSLIDIPKKHPSIDAVYTVRAGKFRRYHGEGFMQLLDIKTMFLNFRDLFYVVIGTFQSWRIVRELKPDVLFSRGGFVSVPVALGSKLNGVPYITHDSDGVPSLANRIISRWATIHAVAMPKELYPYPSEKTITTGVPINSNFTPVNTQLNNKYRAEIGIPIAAELLFIIGGGLGSQRVNQAVVEALPRLLEQYSGLQVVHVAGRANFKEVQSAYSKELNSDAKARVKVVDFIDDVYRYSGAADVIVTRAGATNLAEFAAQGKACIVVPSPFLAGGHQLINADYLREQGAVEVVNEIDLSDDPNRLAKIVSDLLKNKPKRQKLATKFSEYAVHDATQKIVDIINKTAKTKK